MNIMVGNALKLMERVSILFLMSSVVMMNMVKDHWHLRKAIVEV